MPSLFLNRERELAALERGWQAPGGRLELVWGRRRTGKSFLLARHAQQKRAVYYTATQRAPEAELVSLSDQVREALEPGTRDVLAGGPFRSWDEALGYLAAAADRQRLLVVLDEFPYLVESDPSLPSVIQRFWDTKGRQSKLHMILCGSATAILEGLAAERAPLFGRFDARLQIHPFSYREAAAFHPSLSGPDRALVYGILGGMPLYLRQWDPKATVARNLARLFADPSSSLVNEGELLLRTELPDAAGYFRLMSAVAHGRTKFSQIKDEAGMDPTRGLERLTSVRLLERAVPVTEDPARTKLRAYRIADNFLAFWFRFVYPSRGEIERGLGQTFVQRVVLPRLDDYMGPRYEEMCREYVRHRAANGTLADVTKAGSWWSGDGQTEIDILALSGRTPILAGEVKWAKTADRRVLRSLEDKVERLRDRSPNLQRMLFAREGFEGLEGADAVCVNADGLYA